MHYLGLGGLGVQRRLTTGSTVTAAPVELAVSNVDEAQPQVNPNVRRTRHMEGTWAADDLRRAFVAGAAWKHWSLTGFTMFSAERGEAEDVAEYRYPGGRPPNNAVHLTPAADALSATDDTEPQAQVTADR